MGSRFAGPFLFAPLPCRTFARQKQIANGSQLHSCWVAELQGGSLSRKHMAHSPLRYGCCENHEGLEVR